ncbi:hypothetical protein JTF19_05330 [Enterobacteriaceae bacterium RIT814]|nr:hypothetical protein [Enterobacteriaceae bacterium RIT 814]
MTTTNKPMTGEQLDELMTVAVNMQRDSEKVGERPAAMFAYAVQAAVLELRKVRDDASALAAENAGLKQSTPDLQTMMTALDVFFADDEVPERAMLAAYNVLRNAVPTPATDAFLTEVRAQVVADSGTEVFPLYRRAAMLQCSEPVSQRDELPYDPQIAEYEKIMQQAIPDGYVLVPVEPTKEMIDAGWLHFMDDKNPSSKGTYKAMIAAAPQQEVK